MSSLFRYVALGDSTGVGVGATAGDGGYPERLYRRLKARGVNVGILNLAQSGATSTDLVQRQLRKAVESRPALVTVGIGLNDVWKMVPVTTFAMNLKVTFNQLSETGADVVVASLVDLALAPIAAMAETLLRVSSSVFARRVEEMNDGIVSAASKRERFTLVDLRAFSRRELPEHPEYFAADGFHPSSAGYDRWAELMWPAVDAAASRSGSA